LTILKTAGEVTRMADGACPGTPVVVLAVHGARNG
jgi:hypothetical protein